MMVLRYLAFRCPARLVVDLEELLGEDLHVWSANSTAARPLYCTYRGISDGGQNRTKGTVTYSYIEST